jgi:iron complex transport system substrate-binding protein
LRKTQNPYLLIIFLYLIFLSINPSAADAASQGAPAYPQRIVSLGQTITERIYLLGAQDRLIANTVYCVVPEEAKTKEKVGTLLQFNIEKILSLKPDLVLASNLARSKQLRKLKELGIPVIKFSYPTNFSGICRQFIELGEILGEAEKAKEIVDEARREVEEIKARVKNLPKKRVFMQIGIKPLHAVTKQSFLHEYIEFSGGMNIARDAGRGAFSREKVLQLNPEIIIISTMGSSEGEKGKIERATWMKYHSIEAVKKENVYLINPDDICSPTPITFVDALKAIAAIIHPTLVSSK